MGAVLLICKNLCHVIMFILNFRLINDNKELEMLKENAFNNIKNLYYLNLSNTAITSLPINGLKKLKGLYLENVPTLKVL